MFEMYNGRRWSLLLAAIEIHKIGVVLLTDIRNLNDRYLSYKYVKEDSKETKMEDYIKDTTASRKTLHLYLCISLFIIIYIIYIMFWIARSMNKGINKQISINLCFL